ncbi:MAG: HIT family hydrolase [Candidatus Terraquivivens tikiterensis]|uniref:HIT family hydrolase n=1 Tax=Candidatus Terraquivivens tikiterensis TaxID=1980982 RepID=A0A2R7Y3C8_9ARCH|nr:MAG: HIT family hydrolase [Candidatus Terraquivivens tikiterensis]
MKWLWAPWRMAYIRSGGTKECIFCTKGASSNEKEDLVLFKGKRCFVMMNLYPYNTGHLMVAPYRHVGNLTELDEDERKELMELITKSVAVLQKVLNPDGFNVGINLGRVAGAGVEGHVHFHVVPRWSGDTSFMTVIDEVRVIPELLSDTYERLVVHFSKDK